MQLSTNEGAERLDFGILVTKAFALFGVVESTLDYLDYRYLTSSEDAIITGIAFFVLYLSRRPEYTLLPLKFSRGLLVLMCLLGTFTLLPFKLENSIWAIIFPFAFFYLNGLRMGMRISVMCALSMPVGYAVFPYFSDAQRISPYALSQLIGAFLMSIVLAYKYEKVRASQAENLRKLAEQAEASSRAKSDFLSNMSHEIRTPMNAIIGMAQLALNHADDPRQRDYLNKIAVSGEHLLGVLNDILDFSKIEAGRLVLENADFELAQVRQTLENLVAWRAREKGLVLSFEVDPEVPERVWGDQLRINQILLNYLNNAIKFTKQGKIIVRFRKVEESAGSVLLRFEVQDSGIGIAQEQLGQLFRAFHQADASTSRQYGGSGLGLAISQRLAALMGGEVGVESKLGKGSTFWATVRLSKDGVAPVQLGAASSIANHLDMEPIRGARILLAEDHLFNQQVVKEFLEQVGAQVSIANNGEEVLGLLRQYPFDCVLMDMQMPVMDGLEATRLLRSDAGLKNLPVIAMTANASFEDHARCLAAGMNDFIVKPFRPHNFYTTLSKWLSARSGLKVRQEEFPLSCAAEQGMPHGAGEIDLDALLNMAGKDVQRVRGYVSRFIAATEQDIAEIEAALKRGDLAALSELGHRAKSVAHLVGAMGLADLFQTLEGAKENGNAAHLQQVVSELRPLLQRINTQYETAFSSLT